MAKFLSIEVVRGPLRLRQPQIGSYAENLTLGHIAAQFLREDAEDLKAVELRTTLESQDCHTVQGEAGLGMTVLDIRQLGCSCLKLCLAVPDGLLTPVPGAVDPFSALMSQEQDTYADMHWPLDYLAGTNQAVRDIANKLLGLLRADPGEYAGFRFEEHLLQENQFFWALAQIMYTFVPHGDTMAARSCQIPDIFIKAAQNTCSTLKSKQLSQAVCENASDRLVQILGKPNVMSKRFKFSFYLEKLQQSVSKYGSQLRKNLEATRERQQSETASQTVRTLHVVPAASKALSDLSPSEQLAVARISDAMTDCESYQFVRVDELLFTDQEKLENKAHVNPRMLKLRRIKKLFDEVWLPLPGYFLNARCRRAGHSSSEAAYFAMKLVQPLVDIGITCACFQVGVTSASTFPTRNPSK
jgi:hypothetical protein